MNSGFWHSTAKLDKMFYNNGKAFHLEESKCVDLSYFCVCDYIKIKMSSRAESEPRDHLI